MKILRSFGAEDSFIQPTKEVDSFIRTVLRRHDATDGEIGLARAKFSELGEDELLPLRTGHTLVKRRTPPPLRPHLGTEFASDRLWSLIAFEFLALFIDDDIYRESFNCVRRYVLSGTPTDRVAVRRLSGGDQYGAFHALLLSSQPGMIQVDIRLFRWLFYRVSFQSVEYRGPDPVYREDLQSKESFIAASRSTSGTLVVDPIAEERAPMLQCTVADLTLRSRIGVRSLVLILYRSSRPAVLIPTLPRPDSCCSLHRELQISHWHFSVEEPRGKVRTLMRQFCIPLDSRFAQIWTSW